MGKPVKVYEVDNLNKVDTSKYIEGSIFITNRTVGILVNGRIRTFGSNQPNLKQYVKKEEVQKMIDESLEGGEKINV